MYLWIHIYTCKFKINKELQKRNKEFIENKIL